MDFYFFLIDMLTSELQPNSRCLIVVNCTDDQLPLIDRSYSTIAVAYVFEKRAKKKRTNNDLCYHFINWVGFLQLLLR